jgi:type II secretory pathway pseudopilin PulG
MGIDIRLGVFIACLIGSVILALFYLAFDSLLFSPNALNIYSVKAAGNMTYQKDNLTLVIGTSRENTTRPLSIFGINNESNWKIFSTLLSGESNRDVSPSNILFNGYSELPFRITSVPQIIHISTQELQIGKYHGWLYITGSDNFVIPITLASDPKIVQAVTIVIIGILLSIAFWEVYFFFDSKVKRKNANIIRQEANMIDANYLQGVNIAAIPAPYNQDFLDTQTLVQDLRNLANMKDSSAQKIENRYLENAAKIFTADVATIGFGILTAIVGLFSNNYVISLVDINYLNGLTLLGLGLAIGSLKGFVDKPTTK